jgi:hypothetical protein
LVVGSTIQPDYHRNLAGSQHQLVDHEYDHLTCADIRQQMTIKEFLPELQNPT